MSLLAPHVKLERIEMKKLTFKAAAAVLIIGTTSVQVAANPNEEAFFQCMQDCQDFQPDAQVVAQCENWCYEYYNYQ